MASEPQDGLYCPSAQLNMPEAQVLGVLERTPAGPRLSYLNANLEVSHEVLRSTEPVPPLRVLRIAARCEEGRCAHYDGQSCTLASRIVRTLEEVVSALPPCIVRRSCRWFIEQGPAACRRCPQIVTESDRDAMSPTLMQDADGKPL